MPEEQFITTRICRYCCERKLLTDFPLTRGKRFYKCVACINADSRAWQAKNRAKSNAIKRAWEARNPEKARAAKRSSAKLESSKIQKRIYKQERQIVINAQARAAYAADPSKFKARNARRDQRDAQAEGVFTREDSEKLFVSQGGLCANPACRADLRTVSFQADHILALVHGGTHWPDNRQLLCTRCNHIKSSRRPEEWDAITRDPQFAAKWGMPPNPADPAQRGAR